MRYFSVAKSKKTPVICHLPHSSVTIPAEFRSAFSISDKELKQEAKRMADLFTDEFYRPSFEKFGGIVSRVSRIVVDMERFERDQDESMAKIGMGVVYVKTERGIVMRRVSAKRRRELLKTVYRPYHHALTQMVEGHLRENGQCLIFDCHSFPSRPRSYEPDRSKGRPDICLGADKFHTPARLIKMLATAFRRAGFSVKINKPFGGTIVPMRIFQKRKNVFSIMVEVNRKLYMNEERFSRKGSFRRVAKRVNDAMAVASAWFFDKENQHEKGRY